MLYISTCRLIFKQVPILLNADAVVKNFSASVYTLALQVILFFPIMEFLLNTIKDFPHLHKKR